MDLTFDGQFNDLFFSRVARGSRRPEGPDKQAMRMHMRWSRIQGKHRPAIFENAVRSVVMTSPLALDRTRRSARHGQEAWDRLWIYIHQGQII